MGETKIYSCLKKYLHLFCSCFWNIELFVLRKGPVTERRESVTIFSEKGIRDFIYKSNEFKQLHVANNYPFATWKFWINTCVSFVPLLWIYQSVIFELSNHRPWGKKKYRSLYNRNKMWTHRFPKEQLQLEVQHGPS